MVMAGTANFSPCKRYRYRLTRKWVNIEKRVGTPGARPGRCVFVMLNPSTADDKSDDRTVARCVKFAQRWGYTELVVLNLFALRSTDPRRLLSDPDPIGPGNDDQIKRDLQWGERVVFAWGAHEMAVRRARQVMMLLPKERTPYCLGTTAAGHPRHPLYIKGDTEAVPFEMPR